MPLTDEQQSQVDLQNALEEGRRSHELRISERHTRLESIRLAKEVLIENARSLPVDSREVTANTIQEFAQVVVNYVNQ